MDLPKQTVRTLRGMRKYSTVRASAKELGGMMQQSSSTVTKFFGSKFWINDGAVDIGEDFEFIGTTDVVAVAGCAVGNDALAVGLFDLVGLERLNHAVFFGHAAYPFVGFNAHGGCPGVRVVWKFFKINTTAL